MGEGWRSLKTTGAGGRVLNLQSDKIRLAL